MEIAVGISKKNNFLLRANVLNLLKYEIYLIVKRINVVEQKNDKNKL